MAALTQDRNTREIYCNALAMHRVRTKGNSSVYLGSICAADANDKAVPASDAANLVVIGRCDSYTAGGKVIAKTGVFIYDNATGNEALSAADVNKVVYVIDDHTVGKVGGTNKIAAGILRDVISSSEVAVEVGTLAIVPAANSSSN